MGMVYCTYEARDVTLSSKCGGGGGYKHAIGIAQCRDAYARWDGWMVGVK